MRPPTVTAGAPDEATRVSFFPQPVDNSVDTAMDVRPCPVEGLRRAVDEPWTLRPQLVGDVGGRTVDEDYRDPHTTENSTRVMWRTVDDQRCRPHQLHSHDVALTCDDGGWSPVSTPPTTMMNLSFFLQSFTGPVGNFLDREHMS